MNTSRLGNIGEAKLLWELVKRQIPTYTQFGDSERVDIIAEFGNKLNKIQVKASDSLSDNKVTWTLTTTISTATGPKKHKYTKDEVDYFALYSNQLDVLLLLPIDVVLDKTQITIPIPYQKCKGGCSFLNYEEYTIENALERVTYKE